MTFNYCQSCFKKTPQTADIVKFCIHCGKSFENIENYKSIASKSNYIENYDNKKYREKLMARMEGKNISKSTVDKEIDEDEDGNENEDLDVEIDDNVEVPDIDKLKVEIDIPDNSGVPLGTMAKGAARQPKQKSNQQVILDKKQFLAEFQKSASTLRNK